MDKDTLRRRLYICLVLNAAIVGGEFTVGALIRSVGLMSDAMHNLIDQGSLFLTLYAYLLSFRPATARATFGFHRAGIVTALVNAVLLVLAALGLTVMAVRRLARPVSVPGAWVMVVALLSFAANLTIALLLQKAAKNDLNIRGAFWHMFGDAWVCFGVALSGVVIMTTHWTLIDPLISLVVVAAILISAWPILRDSVGVLLDSAPPEIDTVRIREIIQSLPGVENVHDLHLWAVKPGFPILVCHVLAKEDGLSQEVLTGIRVEVAKECGIRHMTIQLENTCCHPEAVHCDLEKLVANHQFVS
jgi:cobalt-zinc-cadmium efflux system protein